MSRTVRASVGGFCCHVPDRVNVRPILQATVTSDSTSLPATITVQLTWNGTTQAAQSFSTAGRSPGETFTVAAQVENAVTQTGRYSWRLDVTTPVAVRTVTGTAFVVAEDSSPYGAGWTFNTDRLYTIPQQGSDPAGLLRAYGSGGWSFYQQMGSSYVSPLGDNGTLTASGGGYLYTTPDGQRWQFNAAGMQTGWTSPDGFETISYTYLDRDGDGQVDDLNTLTAIDGAVSTFSYTGGKLSSIATAGPRTTTFTVSGGDLTQVVNPDGGTRAFSYASHRLTGETFANLVNSWSYRGDGTLETLRWGSNVNQTTTITPAVVQGLYGLAVGEPLAVQTDPLGRVTAWRLDLLGRLLEQRAADGGLWQWGRNTQGWITSAADPLNRTTTYTLDAQGYTTLETLPDTRTRAYEYQAAFHALTRFTDERNYSTTYTYDGLGHLRTVVNPLNQTTTYNYYQAGSATPGLLESVVNARTYTTAYLYETGTRRLSKVTDAKSGEVLYTYDDNGHVQTIRDQLLRTTNLVHDALGRQTRQTAPAPLNTIVWNWSYNGAGLLIDTTDPLGRISRNEYDDRGLTTRTLQAVGNAAQVATLFSYDDAGQGTGQRDANANWSYTTFDPVGRVQESRNALGGRQIYRYDLAGQQTSRRDELGRVSRSVYNLRGWMTQATDALGYATNYGYDFAGNQTTVTDPLNHTTTYVYDELNRRTQAINPLNHTVTTRYDANGNVDRVTNARGYLTDYVFDELDRRTQTIEAVGTSKQRTLTMVYDAVSNLKEYRDGLNQLTRYDYDELNRRTRVTDPLSHAVQYGYDLASNVTTMTDALNKVTTYVYDALNRQVQVLDPLSHSSITAYNGIGQATAVTDALGHTPQTSFDALNRGTVSIDALGALTRNFYDIAGNMTGLTDPVGNATSFLFDGLDREIKRTDPFGKSVVTTFDAAGRRTSVTDRLGRRRDFGYDNADRLTSDTWIPTGGGSPVDTLSYSYDNNNNVLTAGSGNGMYTLTYDPLDRRETQAGLFGLTLTSTYNAADDRTQVADSLGGVLTSIYDAAHRLTRRQFGGTGQTPLRLDLVYTDRNELNALTRYSNLEGTQLVGTSARTYDDAGRFTNLVHRNSMGTALATYVYGYDDANRLTSETLNGTPRNYGYDITNQLTSDGSATYQYDPNGNRTNTGYATGTGNRLLNDGVWTYTYDDEGNQTKKTKGPTQETWTYVYDHRNQLTRVEQRAADGGTLLLQVDYKYDVWGNRIEENKWKPATGNVITRFAYDGQDAWADLNGSNQLLTRRLYLDGVDQLFARISAAGVAAWYLTDRLGSVRDITNAAGAVQDHLDYDGFGNVTESNPTFGDRYKWTGREYDGDTKQQFNRGRYYQSPTGRWTSEDPIVFRAGDPNLYRYVRNKPTRSADPTGWIEWDINKTTKTITMKVVISYIWVDSPPTREDAVEHTSWMQARREDKWTQDRKEAFKANSKKAIEKVWNNHGFVIEIYNAKDYDGEWKPLLDITISDKNPDYKIKVIANKSGKSYSSATVFGSIIGGSEAKRGIDGWWDENDCEPVTEGLARGQITVAHEFGHLIGLQHPWFVKNPGKEPPSREAEYEADKKALMGAGNEMRVTYWQPWSHKLMWTIIREKKGDVGTGSKTKMKE